MRPICALVVHAGGASLLTAAGEYLTLSHAAARARLDGQSVLLCHAPLVRQYLGDLPFTPLDILELWAFTRPGQFMVPSIPGLAQALGIDLPDDPADLPDVLMAARAMLLDDLKRAPSVDQEILRDLATYMGQGGKGWAWAADILSVLTGTAAKTEADKPPRDIFARLLARLPEMADTHPSPPDSDSYTSLDPEAVRARLSSMVHQRGSREERADQQTYTAQAARIFERNTEKNPHVQVIEAGTGIGKTLGYLAPATLWAEENNAPVWISTYTKNLQRQIDQEVARLNLDDADRDRYVVTRKGRENYLCLLNFAEFAAGAHLRATPQAVVASGLMLRWVMMSRDGDFTGVDYPGWLTTLLGPGYTTILADKRGECIHQGCEFYHRCFIERSVRRARHARIVIANHALVMIEAARPDADDRLPAHVIFDEGHHVMDAADSVFTVGLSVREGYDLRRWLLGVEGGRKSRLRGLKRRLEDIVTDEAGQKWLDAIGHAAACLPREGALTRVVEGGAGGTTMEQALAALYAHLNNAAADETPYSIEGSTTNLPEQGRVAFQTLHADLQRLQASLIGLATWCVQKLAALPDDAGPDLRDRLQRVLSSLQSRAGQMVTDWTVMIEDIIAKKTLDDSFDWAEITRIDGRVFDVGFFRAPRNPLVPFAETIASGRSGILMTSATFRDRAEESGWAYAEKVSGAPFLTPQPTFTHFSSPFDYAAQTRVIVVTDVPKHNGRALAHAYADLFAAAGGGALGLFTAITRLKSVRDQIIKPLNDQGLHVYAQHVDQMDNGTLVDLFRADRHACLLGTDAMRDGVDVPGDSLRLIVYDRVPWPTPRLLHQARRNVFGGRVYDEQLTRLRLKQAYGRLIRRRDDRGVFVMLDSGLPSRLCDAFPPGVAVERVPLATAIAMIVDFYRETPGLLPRAQMG